MRRLLGSGLGFALVVALGVGSAQAAQARAFETITVSNTSLKPVKTRTVLDPGHRYRLTVSGTVSDWCTSSCPKGDAAKTAQPNVGVDGVWCYAKWRCPTPEAWQQLTVNGQGILAFAGLTPEQKPYSSSHRYTIEFEGVSRALSLGSSDAQAGSTGDNSGAFIVTITDLGPAGNAAAPSAAVRKLQSDLAKLGFFTGAIDGRLDARTKAAIKSFQRDAGLPIDGDCEPKCLAAVKKALGGGEPAQPPSTAAVTKLQSELARLGLYKGPIDGRLDAQVTAAIKTFQRNVGIPIDGDCDAKCLAALKKALGLDDPARPPGAAPTSRSTVTKLQSDLAKLGLYKGPLDGRYDEGVTDAVKRFQLRAHIPADGKCTLRCQLAIVNALTP